MMPAPGQHVIAVFRNGVRIEGEVISWTDKESTIKKGTTTTVIKKTKKDILYFQIVEAKQKFAEKISQAVKSHDDTTEIFNLKKELHQLENEELAAKLSEDEFTSYQPEKPDTYNNPIKYLKPEALLVKQDFAGSLSGIFKKR